MKRLPLRGCSWLPLLALAWSAPSTASVYNLHLYTDSSPDLVDRESLVRSATEVFGEPQEQATALWRWAVRWRRQLYPTEERWTHLRDPILFFNSYAGTWCGSISGMMQSLWEAKGWRSRVIGLDDHTVAEVSWDSGGSWHMYDASMVVYALRSDGAVASAADIVAPGQDQLSTMLGASGPEPGFLYLYHYAPETGTNPANPALAGNASAPWGFRKATRRPLGMHRTLRNGVESFLRGFSVPSFTLARHGWVYRLNLRPHETYTRFAHPLGSTTAYYRPNIDGTDPNASTPTGNVRGNGEWRFAPDLTASDYRELIHSEAGLCHRSEDGNQGAPLHPCLPGSTAELVLKVYGANVITSAGISLRGVRAGAGDLLAVDLSTDAGINWAPVWQASGTGTVTPAITLSPAQVGGAFEYLIRVRMRAVDDRLAVGLEEIVLRTLTQLNRFSLPQLALGTNRVHLRLGPQRESIMLWPALRDSDGNPRYGDSVDAHANITTRADASFYRDAVVMPATGGQVAHLTWHLTAPTDIVGLRYGGRFVAHHDDAANHVDLSHSLGGGGFTPAARFDADTAATHNGTLYADPEVAPGSREVDLRYEIACDHDASSESTGIQDAMMYVYHQPRTTAREPIEATFAWTEYRASGPVSRQHTQRIDGGELVWEINVGGQRPPDLEWVRVNLAGHGPDGDDVILGYTDGEDVGPGPPRFPRRLDFDLSRNGAFGRPYTVNRPAAALNPDSGGTELTDGNIVPPTADVDSSAVQPLSALWSGDDPVIVTLDLGETQPLAALRVTTHQPDADYCHPARVDVDFGPDGTSWSSLGSMVHDDIWQLDGGELLWGSASSPDFADLPAGGRLAHPFWLIPADAISGRHLRVTFTPLSGHGIGLSEIQLFTTIVSHGWPDREVALLTDLPMPDAGAGPDGAGAPDATGAPDAAGRADAVEVADGGEANDTGYPPEAGGDTLPGPDGALDVRNPPVGDRGSVDGGGPFPDGFSIEVRPGCACAAAGAPAQPRAFTALCFGLLWFRWRRRHPSG